MLLTLPSLSPSSIKLLILPGSRNPVPRGSFSETKERLRVGIALLPGTKSALERDVCFGSFARLFALVTARSLASVRLVLRSAVQKDNAVGSHIQARVRLAIFACVQVHAQVAAF